MTTSIWFWLAFTAGVFIALTIDLAQFKHRGRELSMRAATQRTAIWIVLSLLFNLPARAGQSPRISYRLRDRILLERR
ncbi:MAG: hypothetical protein DME33_03475 [Verrucomicrobia bacterium]|nr:MAG: hypothetical protein DME33_03475 [Verrucomicrobiota bacterium]